VPPLAQFRIVSRLGAGGMGEVYLAEDTRLGRRVALKILLAEVTRDPERSAPGTLRLLQDAKAASALTTLTSQRFTKSARPKALALSPWNMSRASL
jgi:serine/threonine protein kinase